MAVALALVCVGAYAPTTAQALETAKITARPNTGSGSAVVGGTETRITWEVQADADEELSGLSLTFVDGTTFGTDDTRLTMLSGEDLMDRTPMKPTCKADGQTLTIDFGETAPAGGFFRRRRKKRYQPAFKKVSRIPEKVGLGKAGTHE